jgi:hypothetical protein
MIEIATAPLAEASPLVRGLPCIVIISYSSDKVHALPFLLALPFNNNTFML